MSVQVIKLVWRVKGLPPGQKLLLAALADHADPSGICWPFMGTLADETGLHIRTVERLTEALVKAGHLSRARIGRKGYRYRVHPGQPDSTTPSIMPGQNYDEILHLTGSDPAHCRVTPGTAPGRIEPSKNHQRTAISRSNSGTTIPKDWKPAAFADGTACARIYAGWSYTERDVQFEHFIAHHASKGNRFVDYQGAWASWVLNSRRWKRDQPDGQKPLYEYLEETRGRR